MSILPENSLGFVSVDEAVGNKSEEYLRKAFDNVYRYHDIDKELAQGRTNFQLEKFALLETYTLETAYENVLKSRRQMAEGLMSKLLEMQEKTREFEYKWEGRDTTQPIAWEYTGGGPGGGGKKLCWYDLDKMQLEHYLKSSELEVRDRLYQMEHLDKMLEKLTEQNGGVPVSREQFLANEEKYWKTRFSEQILDEMLSSQLGCSLGNIHSVRRSTAPSLVDERNQFSDGFASLGEALSSPEGRMKFISELEQNVIKGYEDVMNVDLGAGNFLPTEERRKMIEQKMETYRQLNLKGSSQNQNQIEGSK